MSTDLSFSGTAVLLTLFGTLSLIPQTSLAGEQRSCAIGTATRDARTTSTSPADGTRIEADSTTAGDDGRTTFAGNVIIQRSGQTLSADHVLFDENDGSLRLTGNVELDTDAMRFSADSGSFNRPGNLGVIENARYTLSNRMMRGQAGSISITADGDVSTNLSDSYITSCPEDRQDWLLEAESIQLNHDEQYGSADDVVLSFMDVPFLYLPYMEFPTGDRRRTGLLVPSFGSSDKRGFELSVPWYWNIAPNYDALISPTNMSDRGQRLDTEFRYLWESGHGRIESEYLTEDDMTGDTRYYTRYIHHSSLTDQLSLDIDISDVSDISYVDDFGRSLSTTSQTYLLRDMRLTLETDDWISIVRTQSHESTDGSITVTDHPYKLRPQIATYGRTALGYSSLMMTTEAEWARFEHDDNSLAAGERITLSSEFSLPMNGTYWFVEPGIRLHHTSYDVQDGAGTDLDLNDRNMVITTLDSGLIFERELDDWTQTLEPRIYLRDAPFRDQSNYPLFDTAAPVFDLDQLFHWNQFVGNDRVSDGAQLTTAVTSRFFDKSGTQRVSLSIGQIHYLDDRMVSLTGGTATERSSDIVAEARIDSGAWSFRTGLQWDRATRRSERENLLLQYRSDDDRLFNLSYRGLSGATPADEISQTDVSFVSPLTDDIVALGRWNYSHTEDEEIDVIAGLGYESCCWSLHLLAQRQRLDSANGTYDNSIMVQFVLRGLGSVSGDQVENTLRDAIRNYR